VPIDTLTGVLSTLSVSDIGAFGSPAAFVAWSAMGTCPAPVMYS
jgi:hypothetical protein